MLAQALDVSVKSSADTEGRPFLPAFSNESELVAWLAEGSHFIALRGRDVLHVFLNGEWEHVVVDPAGATPRALARADARALLDDGVSG